MLDGKSSTHCFQFIKINDPFHVSIFVIIAVITVYNNLVFWHMNVIIIN